MGGCGSLFERVWEIFLIVVVLVSSCVLFCRDKSVKVLRKELLPSRVHFTFSVVDLISLIFSWMVVMDWKSSAFCGRM